jgi:O-antigen/teichoic acid export membrane protein
MSLLRHSAWAAAAAITLTVSRFAFAAIVARRLVQAAYGQYAYGQWLIDLAFLVCSLGATGAVSRYAAEFRHDAGLLAAFFRRWRPFALGLPWVGSLAVLAGVWLSGMALTPFALVMLACWAVANGMWAMQTAALTGLQRFDLIFAANAFAGLVIVTGALLLPLVPSDPGRLFGLMALASGGGAVVGLSITFRQGKVQVDAIESARWRTIRGYAMNIWVTALLWSLVWSRGEMPIVRGYLGDVGVAHYAPALTLFGGAVQGVMLGVAGVAPQLTRLWGEGRQAQAVATARAVMNVQLLLSAGAALVLICLGPELVTLAFGKAYVDAAKPLAIFGLGLVAMSVSLQNHLLQIATDARFTRNTTLLGLLLLFSTAFLLIPRLGLDGAALARGGTLVALAGISSLAVVHRWGRKATSARNLTIAFAVTGAAAMSVLSHALEGLDARLMLLIAGWAALILGMRDQNKILICRSVPRLIMTRFVGWYVGRVSRIKGVG